MKALRRWMAAVVTVMSLLFFVPLVLCACIVCMLQGDRPKTAGEAMRIFMDREL